MCPRTDHPGRVSVPPVYEAHPGVSVRIRQGNFTKRTSIVIFSFSAVSERAQGGKAAGHVLCQHFDIWHY
eukprot:33031-Prymnesium_polylepis.1